MPTGRLELLFIFDVLSKCYIGFLNERTKRGGISVDIASNSNEISAIVPSRAPPYPLAPRCGHDVDQGLRWVEVSLFLSNITVGMVCLFACLLGVVLRPGIICGHIRTCINL